MGLFNSVGQMLDDRPGSPIEDWLRQNGIIPGQTPGYGGGSLFQSARPSRGLFASRPSADVPAASPQELAGNWYTDKPMPALAEDRSPTASPPWYNRGATAGMEQFPLRPDGPTAYGQNNILQDARFGPSNTDSIRSAANSARSAATSHANSGTGGAAQLRPTAARIRANEAAANRRGRRTGRPVENAADAPNAAKPVPVAEPPLSGQANLPSAPYRSQVDPAKNAQLQAAFDDGASLGDLLKTAFSLGIQFDKGDTGSLRRTIAWRDKGGKGARIVPEEEKESLDRGGRARLVDSPAAGIAFNDELPETVASKLKPEQLALWERMATDPKSTPEQLTSLMKGFGYDLANADAIVAARDKGLGVNKNVVYKLRQIPRNPDGATGAAARGLGDPMNFLDEMGAVVDTLGVTGGRENIWNSDRPFLDVLNRNIDQNRSILQADERDHFEARFGGQLASGLLIPVGGGARTAAQFAKYGAAEGFVAGLGAGEGNPLQRAPNAAVGAGLGFAGGYSLGRGVKAFRPFATTLLHGPPLAVLRGDELGTGLAVENVIDRAKSYYRGNMPTAVAHAEVGTVHFIGKGWQKVKSGLKTDLERARLIPAAPAIIERGKYMGREALPQMRKDGVVAFHHFQGIVEMDASRYAVGISVAEDANGKIFYNLNRNPNKLLKKRKLRQLNRGKALGLPEPHHSIDP